MEPTIQTTPSEPSLSSLEAPHSSKEVVKNLLVILTEQGMNKSALKLLSNSEITSLAEVAVKSAAHLRTTTRIVNAMEQEGKEALKRTVAILKDYRGRFDVLGKMLDVMGTDNPFTATASGEIRILQADSSKPKSRKVIGVTGQELTGKVYCVYNPSAPSSETYQSGVMAFQSIFSAFNPQKVSASSRRQVSERRLATLRDELRKLSVEDLLADESLAKETGSRLIVRNLEVYNALREAITECRARIKEFTFTGASLLSGQSGLRVAADPGGQLLNWFKSHIEENENVPIGILLAYNEIIDPDVKLTDIEEKNYLRGLIAYQRNHSFISKDTVLAGLLRDLSVHRALPAGDPLTLNTAVEDAFLTIQDELNKKESDMTLSQLGEFLALSGMTNFREEMNRRTLDTYREEFYTALKHFDFVSFQNGAWRDDIHGESVPMTRLRQHVYGCKLGNKRQGVIQQREFKHIIDAQRLMTLVPDENRALNVLPIDTFKEMVQGVIVAFRKARYIDMALHEYLQSPEGASLEVDKTCVDATLDGWRADMPYGQSYLPQEMRMTGASQKLSISELADRYIDQTRASKDAFKGELINSLKYKWSFEINRLAAFGLYQPESERFWELVERDAQHLVPTADYDDILTRAIRVITNPLVSSPALLTLGVTNRKYISSYAVTVAQEIVNLERDIEEASAPLRAELPSLANKLKELSLIATAGTVYCGGAGTGGSDIPTLTLRWQPASEFFGAVEVVGQHNITIRYYNPQRLRDALETLQDKFIPMRELPSDWLKKAKWVCSYAGAAALKRNGMTTVDRDTFLCVSKMTTVGYNLVSREFVKLVNMLWGDEHQE